jgi:hypothetical protein
MQKIIQLTNETPNDQELGSIVRKHIESYKNKKRPRVGLVIDFTIRQPNFESIYYKFKEQLLVGNDSSKTIAPEDILDENNYWTKIIKDDPTVFDFYSKTTITGEFDITLKKYFMNNEHRLKFLEEWSYNLYGQGAIINKGDINIINTAQAKLCDIVLIDRCTNTRKISNTFAFLAKSGLFIKEVVFTSTEKELDEIKEDLITYWDPFVNYKRIITNDMGSSLPTKDLYDFFIETEQLINK